MCTHHTPLLQRFNVRTYTATQVPLCYVHYIVYGPRIIIYISYNGRQKYVTYVVILQYIQTAFCAHPYCT